MTESNDPDAQVPEDDFFVSAGGSPPEPDRPSPAEDADEPDVVEPSHGVPRSPSNSVYPDVAPPASTYAPAPEQAPQFGRRPPQRNRRPDADGYYPSDYYIGPDWMRIVVGGLAAVTLLVGMAILGFYVFDRFDPRDASEATEDATPTPLPLVPVYECAGDPEPVTEMLPPSHLLIAGRTADSRWLAFRNPRQPPLQLWVRAVSVPDFDTLTVGIVRCAVGADEFPTPANIPTPLPTIGPDITPSTTPLEEAADTGFLPTPTPLTAPTPTQ